ncbi:probable long-chain-alcohol O-fatty-acyltransferase 5 [Vigna umbellata]|uniref:probable long-chain-alcohol O-fatty-acyltransferase 5 n=1 Tax=Vigna umbellata TaxID=87088 RepID=UPI001F5E92D3|nr:probable long-chain-alcohol O-fatty-acyltransferase 5 [Vigna umbellata]
MKMGGEIERFMKVWISTIISLSYCYYIVSRIPKGFLRLLSLLPILCLFFMLPLYLSSPSLVGTISFFLWLATFKLLLFSFNQGPLAISPQNIFLFISIASLPIIPKQHPPTKQNHTTNKPKWLFPLKLLLFAMIIRAYDYKQNLHPNLLLPIYCCHVYLSLELLLIFIGAMIRTVLGFEIESQFNEPYLSTSLQDFWGHRWNLMVSHLLRPTVYNPTRSMLSSFVNISCATSAAMLVTFLVSGLMHELIYYYLTRVTPTWEVTCFFVLHGVCMVVEVVAKKVASHREWQLHGAVSGPLVISFLAITANWLFFPQLLRNGMDTKTTEEYALLIKFFKSNFSLQVL